MIMNALERKPLPVYGQGQNVRDWLHVEDHCHAIWTVIQTGRRSETYNVGGNNQVKNIDVVRRICELVAEQTRAPVAELLSLISYVTDRPGHDHRYAIDAAKITRECGWQPQETFDTGLQKTVAWYIANSAWVDEVRSGGYRRWIEQNYASR